MRKFRPRPLPQDDEPDKPLHVHHRHGPLPCAAYGGNTEKWACAVTQKPPGTRHGPDDAADAVHPRRAGRISLIVPAALENRAKNPATAFAARRRTGQAAARSSSARAAALRSLWREYGEVGMRRDAKATPGAHHSFPALRPLAREMGTLAPTPHARGKSLPCMRVVASPAFPTPAAKNRFPFSPVCRRQGSPNRRKGADKRA